ncbi:hypothetical protein GGS24DRAFT_504839 [Hypoxylon argillaceum]|nr:hypothetical protein GGS24DRAFT_504839 [Hypoxylon argillaceum]
MESPAESSDSPTNPQTPDQIEELCVNPLLQDLQPDERRKILDIIAQFRKCGLESVVSLPQIVVCGDQSSEKSSTVEAIMGIPFPRDEGLCTQFATEIILRRGLTNTLTIRVIPDETRSQKEKESIKAFSKSITDFDELP